VPIGRERQRNLRKPVAPIALPERQRHRHVGPLEQLVPIRQEAIDQAAEAGRGGMKGGADGIAGHLLQLTGDNGGEQGMRQTCKFRLGEISVLPTTLNHPYPEPARQRSSSSHNGRRRKTVCASLPSEPWCSSGSQAMAMPNNPSGPGTIWSSRPVGVIPRRSRLRSQVPVFLPTTG
jgi:hypothetical protein